MKVLQTYYVKVIGHDGHEGTCGHQIYLGAQFRMR